MNENNDSHVGSVVVLGIAATILGFLLMRSIFSSPAAPDPLANPQLSTPTDVTGFAPLATFDRSFVATVTVQQDGFPDMNGTVYNDGRGTMRFEARQGDDFFEMYVDGDRLIYCEVGQCVSESIFSDDIAFDPRVFVYTTEDLHEFAGSLIRGEREPCGNSTCEVWQSQIASESLTKVTYDTISRLVHTIEGVEDGAYVSIMHSYEDVDIILPLNVEELEES